MTDVYLGPCPAVRGANGVRVVDRIYGTVGVEHLAAVINLGKSTRLAAVKHGAGRFHFPGPRMRRIQWLVLASS
ncbi:hypothetical protein D3C75_1310620 [compost metagenome]